MTTIILRCQVGSTRRQLSRNITWKPDSSFFEKLPWCCPCCVSGHLTQQDHCYLCLHIHLDKMIVDTATEKEEEERGINSFHRLL